MMPFNITLHEAEKATKVYIENNINQLYNNIVTVVKNARVLINKNPYHLTKQEVLCHLPAEVIQALNILHDVANILVTDTFPEEYEYDSQVRSEQ